MNLREKANAKKANKPNFNSILTHFVEVEGFEWRGKDKDAIYLECNCIIDIYISTIDNIPSLVLDFSHVDDTELTDDDRWLDISKLSIQEITSICEHIIDGDFSDFIEQQSTCGIGGCTL